MNLRLLPLATLLFAAPLAAEPLVVDNGRLFIPVTVNGKPTEALLDSGAEMSVADLAFARQIGLVAATTVDAHGTGKEKQRAELIENVELGALGLVMKDRTIAAMDLSEVAARLIKRPTRFILGRDLFDNARVRIDLAHADVGLVGAAATPAGTRLDLVEHKGIETIPVTVGNVEARADLDFGNGSEPLISRKLATLLGLEEVGTASGGGLGGAVDRDLVRIPHLVIAGHTFHNVVAAVDDKEEGLMMNVGTSLLRAFVVTLDFAGNAAWFQPAAED